MSQLNKIQKALATAKQQLEKTSTLVEALTENSFPKIVLSRKLKMAKIFVVQYYIDTSRLQSGSLEFLTVSVVGEGYTRTYRYEDFIQDYVAYDEKYAKLHYPPEE